MNKISQVKSGNGTYKKTVLNNGLRVVTETIPSVRSITIGIWVDVGSRNEPEDIGGVSHLVEHMLFKGTKKRTAKQIAESLESIGGHLNAFTSKEQTCYIARILDEHLDVAIDVLSDLTCHATISPANLKKEKKVICEEISESLESPSDHIHDISSQTFWQKDPLGRNILGEADEITNMPRAKIVNYIKNNYRSGSIVIAASGSVSHNKLIKLVNEKFSFNEGVAPKLVKAVVPDFKRFDFVSNTNNQVHLCLGYPGVPYINQDKLPLLAIHAYLGGGMSSVLFQKIREEKGLAYTVYTYLDLYRDAGIFGIYAATDKKNFPQAVDIIIKELNKFKKKRIPSAKLDQIKAQLKGNLTLGMESTSSRMNRMARNELMTGTFTSLQKTLNAIDKINGDDIARVADLIFDHSQLALSVLGPVEKESIKDII